MGVDLRLAGTPALSWRRLKVLCIQLAEQPTSSTHRVLSGRYADWPLPVALQARQIYALEVANWQRTVLNWDEKKFGRPPEPPDPIPVAGESSQKPPQGVTAAALLEFNRRTRQKAVA